MDSIGDGHIVSYYEYQKGLTGVTMDTTDTNALDKATVVQFDMGSFIYPGDQLGLLKMTKTGAPDEYC